MNLRATAILEGENAKCWEVSLEKDLTPRKFVDLLDLHKVLLLQSAQTEQPLTIEDFGKLVVDLQLEAYPYIGGAAPRTVIPVAAGKDIVFTANESPPDQPIPFHHELAQTPNPPEYIFFYCAVAAETGGETPLIDSTLVYRHVKETYPQFLEQLQLHGARYIRTLPPQDDPSSPIGRSYQNTWQVTNPTELEEKLSKIDGCSWEWQPDGSVRITSQAVPALRFCTDHVQNYIFQYAFANSIVAAYLGWQDSRNDRKNALRFGNMEPMPESVLEGIAQFMENHRILYKWQKGDIFAINNRLVMHSRNPFVGPRRVLASIWGPPEKHVREMEPPNGVAVGPRSPSSFHSLQPADPLVFGFWKVPKETCAEVCYQAILAGYRRLDCACDYGNEVEVGQGIQRALQEGVCRREDLFVTSKLWNTYHRPEHVPMALSKTLQDLQLSYVDEYLVHFPISMEFVPFESRYPPEWTNMEGKMVMVPQDLGATWKAMEDLVDKSLCKEIGVCNFSTQLLRQLLSTCRIRPSALQIELHPHNTQERLVRFAREAGMRVTAFSVLGASSYLELGMADSSDMLVKDPTIVEIAMAKNKTPAQILLRWALQRSTLPLCKTAQPERMRENRDLFDFYLTGSEMDLISSKNKNRRYNDPGEFCEPGMGTFCPIYD